MTPLQHLYVGTHRRAHHADPADVAFGIYAFAAGEDGEFQLVGTTESPKPGWIARHPVADVLYAVNEVRDFDGPDTGGISAFAIDPATGIPRFLGALTLDAMPCHCAVDATGRFLLVATFGGGSVHLIALTGDGRLGAEVDVHRHRGSSVHPRRQTSPHAHAVAIDPSNRFVLVPDLGTDRVEVYALDHAAGRLRPCPDKGISLPPASGPRHIAFSADGAHAYLANEMSAMITVLAHNEGELRELQTVDLLPDGFAGLRSGAAILVHSNGRHVYATTRSHGSSGLPQKPGLDTLVWFAIDPASGLVRFEGRIPSGGGIPRDAAFEPGGRRLFVAHQCDGRITIFDLDPVDGTPTPTGEVIDTPVPVCLLFGAH